MGLPLLFAMERFGHRIGTAGYRALCLGPWPVVAYARGFDMGCVIPTLHFFATDPALTLGVLMFDPALAIRVLMVPVNPA
jgi:hypothetical protein